MPQRHYGLNFVHPGATQPKHLYRVAPTRANPPKVDLSTPPMPAPFEPCLDQEALGACGPNAVAENLVHEALEEGETDVPLPSRLFIYWISRSVMGTVYQDSGVENAKMFGAIGRYGFCDESLWPYNIARFRSRPTLACFSQARTRTPLDYAVVPQDIDQIRSCLADRKPFVYGFQVYQSFESNATEKTGIVSMPSNTEQFLGGHDVLVVGYDDSSGYLKFKNSWGPDWGDHGYGYMPYAYALDPALSGDFWSIERIGHP